MTQEEFTAHVNHLRELHTGQITETHTLPASNIKHYVHALARWKAAGMPTREQIEVERLEAICRECKHYRNGRCAKCRCCVNKRRVAVLNKIKMATENCPVGKW